MIAAVTGCGAIKGPAIEQAPFLTKVHPPEGVADVVLTAALPGRITERNGCFVFKAGSHYRAAIFASSFTVDRAAGRIYAGTRDGRYYTLGRASMFSGGEVDPRNVESMTRKELPRNCPGEVVEIDDFR